MVEEINEIAVIFKRVKNEYELVEEFIPYKVVEGYYYEDEECFIDSEQNVYSHMASLTEVGNVFAGRTTIYDAIKANNNLTLESIKKRLLELLKKYEFYKNVDESSDEYCIIKTKDKKTGEICIFNDKETVTYYEMYRALKNYANSHASLPYKIENETSITEKEVKEVKKNNDEMKTPIEIIENIKKTIKGQDKALESIVTLLWMRSAFPSIPKSNILLIGPSGVGKTAIFKKIKSIFDVPVTMFSITGTSQSGYKGHDIEEMLSQLYYDSNQDIKKAEHGIVFIDEFDKIASNRDTGDIGTIAVQNELLKLIEGCTRQVSLDSHRTINIDTTNIMFVCCGAFSELFEKKITKKPSIGFASSTPDTLNEENKITTDKIIKYGIIRELAGRLPVIVELNDINDKKDILKDILLNSDESLFTSLIEALNSRGINVDNLYDVIDYIIDDAITKKLGARGLIGPTRNIFLKIFYEVANNPEKYEGVIIGKNIINDNNDFELVPKKVKRKIKEAEIG